MVEDEFFVAVYIDGVLSDAGFEVVGPVGRLDEAKLLARDENLDGAVLDVSIVGGRVDDVADILSDREVPFVFVTSYDRDNLPTQHREATLIAKPFRDDHLVGELRSLIL